MNTLFLSFLNSLKYLLPPQNSSISHYFLYICGLLGIAFCGLLIKIIPGFAKNLQEKEHKKEQKRLEMELKIKTMVEEGKERRAKILAESQKNLTDAVNKINKTQQKNNEILASVKSRNEDIWEEVRQ